MAKKKKAARKAPAIAKTRFQTATTELVHRSKINFLPGNAQAMTGEQRQRVQKSIEDEEVGLVDTPVWNRRSGNLVGGNHRIASIDKAEGHQDYAVELSVIDVDPAREKAIALMLNNPRNRGSYDPRKLAEALGELPAANHHQTGFTDEDRDWLLENMVQRKDKKQRIDDAIWGGLAEVIKPDKENAEEVDTPDLGTEAYSSPGDIWTLGRHRIMCGDATQAAEVGTLLDGEKPFLMVTDPPYGVDYDAEWRGERLGQNGDETTNAVGRVENDERADWQEAWDLFPGVVGYVWHAALHATTVAQSMERSRLQIRCQIIWDKGKIVPGRGAYHYCHESCWYGSRGVAKWKGDRDQSTIWRIEKLHATQGQSDDGKTIHSTQKPVECMARPIKNHGDPDDDVYDPFLGSGTTLIACEQLERRCFGMEINPIYVDLIIRRWQNYTGQTATRHDGLTLADLEDVLNA